MPNECFGLLGLNGAGKTSTLQILIGDLESSSGKAYLNGMRIGFGRNVKDLGYCPQFDYLVDFLTVKETLELFASIRGLRRANAKDIIKKILDNFKLHEFKKTLVQNLSGGNKRKLSSAIAFIGKPQTVILDEVKLYFSYSLN